MTSSQERAQETQEETNQSPELIEDNEYDIFMTKVQALKKERMSSKGKRKAKKCEDDLATAFGILCESHLGITEEQIKETFDETNFRNLEKSILKHAKSGARWTWAWSLLIPIAGWLWLYVLYSWPNPTDSPPLFYTRYRKKLEKLYGEDYSLYKKWFSE